MALRTACLQTVKRSDTGTAQVEACPAMALPLLRNIRVEQVIRMTFRAMRPALVKRRWPSPARYIDISRNKLHVLRVYARRDSAQVVYLEAFRDRTNVHFVGDTVGKGVFAIETEEPIPLARPIVLSGHPKPTWRAIPGGAVLINLRKKALFYSRINRHRKLLPFGVSRHGVSAPLAAFFVSGLYHNTKEVQAMEHLRDVHYIPERHRPRWAPMERHRGVDFCAYEACGVLTMHREARGWTRAFRRLLYTSSKRS